jgi:hypothetical protein
VARFRPVSELDHQQFTHWDYQRDRIYAVDQTREVNATSEQSTPKSAWRLVR